MTLARDINLINDRDDSIAQRRIQEIEQPSYRDVEDISYDSRTENYRTRSSIVNDLISNVDLHFEVGEETIRQWIDKVLRVENNLYPIYSENYGFQLLDVLGTDLSADEIASLMPMFLARALTYNPYITSVENITTRSERDRLFVNFSVTLIDEEMLDLGYHWDIG